MENTSAERSFSSLLSSRSRTFVNPCSLINVVFPKGNIRPFRWVLGLLVLFHFLMAFSVPGSSNYLSSLFRLLAVFFIWIGLTVLLENLLLGGYGQVDSDISNLSMVRKFIASIAVWNISLFLYLGIFILA